jgi:hypothetical protein
LRDGRQSVCLVCNSRRQRQSLRNSSDGFAIFAGIRRASSREMVLWPLNSFGLGAETLGLPFLAAHCFCKKKHMRTCCPFEYSSRAPQALHLVDGGFCHAAGVPGMATGNPTVHDSGFIGRIAGFVLLGAGLR